MSREPRAAPSKPRAAPPRPRTLSSDGAVERAAALFRAMGDGSRLRLSELLLDGERRVSDLAAASGARVSSVSQQLRVLYLERVVRRRRSGIHVYYAVADDHIATLIRSALDHAAEARLHRK